MPPSLGARVGARMVDGLLVGIVAGIAATILDIGNAWIAVPLTLVYDTVLVAGAAVRTVVLLVLVVLWNGFTVARRRDDRRGRHDLAAGTRPVSMA